MIGAIMLLKLCTQAVVATEDASSAVSVSPEKFSSRCDYLCQNDDACRSGRCVLTQCLDTPSCFRYCFYCNYEEKCYEAGQYCFAYRARSNSPPPSISHKLASWHAFLHVFLVGVLLNYY
jgi:hypothetical protein